MSIAMMLEVNMELLRMSFSKRAVHAGFTLVELLIVVIILAVLASVAIPQFSSSTADAKESVLDTTLSEMRNAIELYYHQHGEYPSVNADGSGGAADSNTAFVSQLTKYTDADGNIGNTKTATIKYGPYLKKHQIPDNPIDGSNAVLIVTTGNLTATGTDAGGWWFDNVSGKFIPNVATYYDR